MRAGRLLAIIIAFVVLLGGGYAAWRLAMDRQNLRNNEAELKRQLASMRAAIQQFHTTEGRYPRSLDELIPRYLRRIPVDPLTRAADWHVVTEESVQPNADFTDTATKTDSYVIGVHSSAPAPYPDW